MVENVFFASTEDKSSTVAILSLTFFTAVTVSSARASNAVVSALVSAATFAATSAFTRAKSEALVRSSVLSAADALASLNFVAFVFTTSTTEFRAASKASASVAPDPSAAPANAFTTLMICWLAFSTAKASAASTPSAYGLKDKGSTPSGRPSTSATCSLVIPASSISVVVGVTTLVPAGALRVMPDKTVPEDVSMVVSSATAITVYVLFVVVRE